MLKSKDSLNSLIVIIDNIKASGTMCSISCYTGKLNEKDKQVYNQFMASNPFLYFTYKIKPTQALQAKHHVPSDDRYNECHVSNGRYDHANRKS